MFRKIRSELRYPAEFFWLLALVFFLPLFEAPKNLCWLGYVLTWLYGRFRARDWGGPWDKWDSLIALWIASAYVVAAFAGIHYDEWSAANDVLRYCSVLWLVKRSNLSERALLAVLGTIVVSTLIALAWGWWGLYVSRTESALALNSVGHVNHSAVYIVMVLGFALSLALAYWQRMGQLGRLGSSLSVLVLSLSVFFTDSRAAAASALLLALVLSLTFAARRTKRVRISFLVVMLGGAILLAMNPAIVMKTENQMVAGTFAYRGDDWSNALVEWREYPLFGVGLGNFGRPTLAELRDWNKRQDWAIHPSPHGMQGHAHSIYLNALAERGLIGASILLLVLISWGTALVRAVPRAQDPPLGWALSGAAFSGWFVTMSVGLINTTLHHETGILAVLLFGLWLSRREELFSPGRAAR